MVAVKLPHISLGVTALNAPHLHRRLHRFGSILIALPLLLVICTGLLLQVKKEWAWIQPTTLRGTAAGPILPMETLMKAVQSVTKAGLSTWDDIDRVDFRPGKSLAKFRGKNRWEVQVDTTTATVLSTEFRRSDLIESLHDGSWFHDRAKLFIFLPVGAILLGLWFTGVYLWWLPYGIRRKRRRTAIASATKSKAP